MLDDDTKTAMTATTLDQVGDYRPGSIRRIKLKNFLTHGDVEFSPGPRLNMVVGANGTGKSTILNAICLGLGGEPKVLGRADDLRAFIMHGKNEAMIEIELAPLKGEEVPHTIQRFIDRSKGSTNGRGRGASTFFVNGEKVTIQAVRELVVSKHNIQIDNLCTFLPQDKVGNFSGFTDQERLLETEKTLPSNQFFYKRHMELIEKEEDIVSQVSNVESMKENLAKKKHEFSRLEIGRQREEERVAAEAQVDLLRKKRIWLEFEQIREECVSLKSQKDVAKTEYRASVQDMAPLEEKLQRAVALKLEVETKIKKLEHNVQKAEKEMEKQSKKIETHDDGMEEATAELNALDSKRGTLERSLNDAKLKLKELENSLASAPPRNEIERDLQSHKESAREAKAASDTAKREAHALKQQYSELEEKAGMLQQNLAKLNDDGARRRENVLRKSQNLAKICGWIDKNRSKFRRPVWGPIAVEVAPKSQNTAAYIEFHIPGTILKSFVVETDEDRVMLYSEIREKLNIPINVLNTDGKQLTAARMYSNEKMDILKKNHGVVCYLDETFTTPDPVMVALQKFAGVHKVLVGAEKTQDSIERRQLRDFLAEPDAALGQSGMQGSCIFAAKGNQSYRYSQSVSSYSGKVNSRMDYVSPARMLAPGVSEEQKAGVENDLTSVHQEIAECRPLLLKAEKGLNDLESTMQQKHASFSSLKSILDQVQKISSRIERQQEKIDDLKRQLSSDNTDEKMTLTKKLLNRLANSIAAISAHGEQQTLMMKNTICMAGLSAQKSSLNDMERLAREAVAELNSVLKKLEAALTKIGNDYTRARNLLIRTKEEAERIAPIVDDDGNDMPLKARLEELDVSDVTEVDAAIEEAERILKQSQANPEIIKHYEKLKDEIELVEAQLADIAEMRENGTKLLMMERKDWETRLEDYVQKINALFTTYMAEMGCTGEVYLTKGPQLENDDGRGNFKQWGLEIRVSFREGCKAEVLSAQRHSGGERSVSTILYLMSLQHLMVAPFRCVDEINQGLDERNERLVFSRIVANACGTPGKNPTDHSGQYFLITPKLLPNLTKMENEAITILFVFNGPYNFKTSADWQVVLNGVAPEIDVVTDEENDDHNSRLSNSRSSKKSRLS